MPSLNNGKAQEKLEKEDALVADVGCGHGISTIIMAKAYPNSKFIGFDNHQASIERTRELAREEGLSEEQIKFEVFSFNDYPSYSKDTEKYDLIAFFNCLHDMGDLIGATSYALKSLKPDGTVMIVEPFANDKAGIINTVNCAKKIAGVGKVYAIVDAFHLPADGGIFEKAIDSTLKELQKIDPKYIVPCHCTGWKATNKIIDLMPNKFIQNAVCTTFTF